MRRRNPNAGLVVFWVKLRQRGYSRSITSLYRILIKMNLNPKKLPNPKYIPKPYEKMLFPGQRVQIDVKFVPSSCLVGKAKNQKFYQYTALDEYSRFRYVEAFEEHSSYSSAIFLEHLIKAFHFPIHCVQTDNGQEFTKRLSKTKNPTLSLFENMKSQALHFSSWTFPCHSCCCCCCCCFSLPRTFSSIVGRIRDESPLSCFLEVFLKFP